MIDILKFTGQYFVLISPSGKKIKRYNKILNRKTKRRSQLAYLWLQFLPDLFLNKNSYAYFLYPLTNISIASITTNPLWCKSGDGR